jgi:hypothetical protein
MNQLHAKGGIHLRRTSVNNVIKSTTATTNKKKKGGCGCGSKTKKN